MTELDIVKRLRETADTMSGTKAPGGDGDTYVVGYYSGFNQALDREAADIIEAMAGALEKIKNALMTDPPDNGPQKEVYRDETIYRVNGNDMYLALEAARRALSLVQKDKEDADAD